MSLSALFFFSWAHISDFWRNKWSQVPALLPHDQICTHIAHFDKWMYTICKAVWKGIEDIILKNIYNGHIGLESTHTYIAVSIFANNSFLQNRTESQPKGGWKNFPYTFQSRHSSQTIQFMKLSNLPQTPSISRNISNKVYFSYASPNHRQTY